MLERGGDPLHIYKAVVEKVVDGDTLLVRPVRDQRLLPSDDQEEGRGL